VIDQDIVDLGDDELIRNRDGRGGSGGGRDDYSSDVDPEDVVGSDAEVMPDRELGSDNGDAGTGHLAGGNNADQPGDMRPSLNSLSSNRPPSVASIASKVIKRSRSLSFNLEDLARLGSEASVKREP
jgi:hypothetical protein